MPRYKDSPEVRAAKQERKNKLRELLSVMDVEDMSDLKSLFKEMVGEVLENGLEAELDDELGYTRYDYRNKDTENSRNGHSRKTMKTSAGDLEIAVPRDRNGEFEPRLVKKNETTLSGDIEEKIISMYAKGMTTNDISAHIEDIYGIEVSDSLVSRITDKFCSYKDIKALMADLKRGYGAVDEETALYELKNFAQNGIQNIQKYRLHGKHIGPNFLPISSIRSRSER